MVKLTTNFVNRSGWVTYDDFRSRIADGEKADLIDGVIYMASPDNTDAADLFVWLIRLLAEYLDNHNLGKVYGSRVAMKLEEKNNPSRTSQWFSKKGSHSSRADTFWVRPISASKSSRRKVCKGTTKKNANSTSSLASKSIGSWTKICRSSRYCRSVRRAIGK